MTQNCPELAQKSNFWSQQEKSTKCSKFISFKPSKISKFRHFINYYNKILTSGLLRLIKMFDFWIFVALESNFSPSKESGKIKVLKFCFKIHLFSLSFQPFSMPRFHSFEKLSWEQCRTKEDKSQLYIPHQKPVEYLGFSSTLTILSKKSFFLFCQNLAYFVHQCSTISDIVSSKYFHFLGTCLETNLHTRLARIKSLWIKFSMTFLRDWKFPDNKFSWS